MDPRGDRYWLLCYARRGRRTREELVILVAGPGGCAKHDGFVNLSKLERLGMVEEVDGRMRTTAKGQREIDKTLNFNQKGRT